MKNIARRERVSYPIYRRARLISTRLITHQRTMQTNVKIVKVDILVDIEYWLFM